VKKNKGKIIGIRLSEESRLALTEKAEKNGITMSTLARIAIEKELKNVK
jgi:predicted DNA-binding protein